MTEVFKVQSDHLFLNLNFYLQKRPIQMIICTISDESLMHFFKANKEISCSPFTHTLLQLINTFNLIYKYLDCFIISDHLNAVLINIPAAVVTDPRFSDTVSFLKETET